MASKRRLRSQRAPGDEEDEELSLEAEEPPKKKPKKAATKKPEEPTPKHSSSRIASSKEALERIVPPIYEIQLESLLSEHKKRIKSHPWIPDVLQKLPSATGLAIIGDLSQPMKNDLLYRVSVEYEDENTDQYYLKIFGDYSAGWAESVMVEEMEELCPEAAVGKLKPTAHGPCIRKLGLDESKHNMTYFALLPPSGASVDKLPKKIDLNWPLQTLCQSILSMLNSFSASDPTTSDFKFYHGDTNDDNYLVDIDSRALWMIDFGRSYFRWSDKSGAHYLTPRKESTPQNDIFTFYRVIQQLLKFHNSAVSKQNAKTWSELAKFVSHKSVNPVEEINRFTSWCGKHGIALDIPPRLQQAPTTQVPLR